MGQKGAQLPFFEKVQHPKEKSWAKSFFAKVIRAVAKVYFCDENLGGSGTLSVTQSSKQGWNFSQGWHSPHNRTLRLLFLFNESHTKFCHAYSKIECRIPNWFHGIRIMFLNPDELTVVKQEKVIYYFTKVPLLPTPLCVYLHVRFAFANYFGLLRVIWHLPHQEFNNKHRKYLRRYDLKKPVEACRRWGVASVRSSIYCLRWIWKDWRRFCGFFIVWKLWFPVRNWFLFACACLWYENTSYHEGIEILRTVTAVRQRLHERSFIWNRIDLSTVTIMVRNLRHSSIQNGESCTKFSARMCHDITSHLLIFFEAIQNITISNISFGPIPNQHPQPFYWLWIH